MDNLPVFEYPRTPNMGAWFDHLTLPQRQHFLTRLHARFDTFTWEYFEAVLPADTPIVFTHIRSLAKTLIGSYVLHNYALS